jgi:hypothetical protein
MNVSPSTSSERSERGQNEQMSPTPHRHQRRPTLRAEKKAEGRSADLLPFYEVYPDQTKHCKFCL